MAVPPCGADVAHHLVGGERIGGVVHGDGPAARCGEPGGCRTDAAAAAGDQDHLFHLLLLPWVGDYDTARLEQIGPIAGLGDTMPHAIDYFLAPQSPWTYLGHERLVRMAREAGAVVRVLPMDLGKVFPVSGGLPLAKRAPQRQAYRLVELQRFRDHLKLPLTCSPGSSPSTAIPPRA
jgi:hypothetical protein